MQMTNAFGACFLMPSPTCSITLRLMPSRSSRLMPGLRGTPAVTMHDVGALDGVVVVGAGELGVEAVDRRGLRDVERLALRDAFGDVEQHDVAELLQADEMGERAADLAGADQCDLVTRHVGRTLDWRPRKRGRAVINPFGSGDKSAHRTPAFQPM